MAQIGDSSTRPGPAGYRSEKKITGFALYDSFPHYQRGAFMEVIISTAMEPEITNEELANYVRRFQCLPIKTISMPVNCPDLTGAASMVAMGYNIFIIGGKLGSNLPSNRVWRFNSAEGIREWAPMLKERAYSAVVSVGTNIYVFGGLSPFEEDSSPWAEFLDISKENHEWKALSDPMFRRPCVDFACTQLFALPYDDHTILIGCGFHPHGVALRYNVADGSWSRYEDFPRIRPWGYARPVVTDKTIYWVEGSFLWAFELDTRINYSVDMSQSLFPSESFLSSEYVPLLVHLEDKIFGFFSVFYSDFGKAQIVECTKVRVSKDYPGILGLSVVGYESYQCGMQKLSAVVPLGTFQLGPGACFSRRRAV